MQSKSIDSSKDTRPIVENFNVSEDDLNNNSNKHSNLPIPTKETSTQCNFCLKRIKMNDMASHLKLCTLRVEPCRYLKKKTHFI